MNSYTIDGNEYWIDKEEYDALIKFREGGRRWAIMVNYPVYLKRKELNRDDRKLAYVFVGRTRKMVWMDKRDMIAYKMDGYDKTWIKQPYTSFERWCTSFDM